MQTSNTSAAYHGNGEAHLLRPHAVHHRVYLQAYDLISQDLYDRTRTAFLVRAGVLFELARRGRLIEAGGNVQVVSAEPTGDLALDEALRQIAGHDRSWKAWLRRDYKQTLQAVEAQMQTIGLLVIEESKLLGLVSRTRVTVTDPAVVEELQQQARTILRGSQPASEIDPADAAVVALAAAGRVPAVVSRKASREGKDLIDALTGRVGTLAPGLEAAFRGIRMTMTAAQGGMGGS
jgi:hypothetical protein